MERIKLLPRAWQSVGWGIVGGGIALLLYSLFCETDSDIYFASTPWAFGAALSTIGFLLIAFSSEEFEDERINSIRFKTLGVMAVVYAVMLILYPTMDLLLARELSPMGLASMRSVRSLFGVLPLYVVIFKITVWIKNRDLSNEE